MSDKSQTEGRSVMGGNVGHTPGPWAWFGNAKNNEVYLATSHSGRRYVMSFKRWGMRGAQPMFQPAERSLVPAEKLFTFEVGDREVRGVEQAKADESVYRLDIDGIDCADARLIAAAPELLEALLMTEQWLTACLESENIVWDFDQKEAATFDRDTARAAIAKAKGEV